MKFLVRFSNNGDAVWLPGRRVGLNQVDLARSYVGVRVPLDRIADLVYLFSEDPEVPLPEEEARKAGLFGEDFFVRVAVPRESLNKYASLVPLVSRSETGEIRHIAWDYRIDNDALLRDWASAGYPTEWDPAASEEQGADG